VIIDWCDSDGWYFIDARMPDAVYNITVQAPKDGSIWSLAKEAFEQVFDLQFLEHEEMMDVMVLRKKKGAPSGLSPVEDQSSRWSTQDTPGGFGYVFKAGTMEDLVKIALKYVDVPVLDETGLEGHFAFTVSMDHWEPDTLFPAIEGLGLKLEKANRKLRVMRVVNATPTDSK
jgi:uncharacterized protein (TIGR03435 family)